MSDKYILNGHTPVPELSLEKWGAWFETAERHVADTVIPSSAGTVRVSTVFLGLDHQYSTGPPILFETLVFGGKLDGEMDRCSTWEEAEAMHHRMLDRVVEEFNRKSTKRRRSRK